MSNKQLVPIRTNIIIEILALFFSVGVPGVVWGSTIFLAYKLIQAGNFLALAVLPLFACLLFIAILFCFRILLPKLKEGLYDIKKDKMVVFWYLHMCLNRSGKAIGLSPMLRSSNLLKYLHMKALGAKIAYTSNYSLDLEIADPSLTRIDANTVLGGQCYIGSHVVIDGKLGLGRVHIKEGAFVGFGCIIGQGTTIGEGSVVGSVNKLYRNNIPDGYKLQNFEWENGSPNIRRKNLADIEKSKEDQTYQEKDFISYN